MTAEKTSEILGYVFGVSETESVLIEYNKILSELQVCATMSTKARRFSIHIDMSIPPDADDLFEQLSEEYEFLTYVGVYTNDGKLYIYLQFENLVVQSKLVRILVEMGIAMNGIVKSKRMIGEILSEHGEMPKMGRVPKKRKHVDQTPSSPQTIINNINNVDNSVDNSTMNNIDNSTTNNVKIVIVNPIGMESLDHISPEFIQDPLAEHNGPDVVFKFGTKMYSNEENMNFKTNTNSGFISGRLEQDGAWETHRKSEGFYMLMDNLKSKNEEAVLKHMASLPYEDLLKFERAMGWIHEHKTSGLQEDVPVYNKFVKQGFNLLTANIQDKKRRIERDCGKKLRLV